ncbi:hypothetical protein ABTY20_06455 [Streptomyces sp. NPDC126497]|uniref:hypothetical protein n=1 Tax=Streptomyces sp. NPDC126497 TaxID=3155313 RepID=UPI00332C0D75
MEITEQDQVVIAQVDREEAEHQTWKKADAPIDIVRLTDSEDLDEATLCDLGFVARPKWLNWCAPTRASQQDFEAALSGTERRNIRLGRRTVQDEGMRIRIRKGLTEEYVDEFLTVYDRQIAGMRRGKNFARRWRDRLLAAAGEHVGVSVHQGTTMIVGSLWWARPEPSVLQMRFSAAAPDARSGRVMRAAYTEAFQYARDQGLTHVSLGNDPSLFGHVVQPGLFNFKSRFGFAPVPSQVLDPSLAGEFADRILRLDALSDPALVVTWGSHRGASPSWPDAARKPGHDLLVLSRAPGAASADRFRTDGFREVRSVSVAAGGSSVTPATGRRSDGRPSGGAERPGAGRTGQDRPDGSPDRRRRG